MLDSIPDESERWFAEYLDHNELGLAFEVLAQAADAQGASIDCWLALAQAASEMQLPASDRCVELVRTHVE